MNDQAPKTGNALTDEQRELQELRKQVKRLTMERDILKMLLLFWHQTTLKAIVDQPAAEQNKRVSKGLLCKLFGLIKSSYYYGLKPPPVRLEIVKYKALIRQIFNDSQQSVEAHTNE